MGNKYEFWLSPEGLDRLRQWSGQGLNDAQIAREAGVRPDTLRAWKKKFPRLAQALGTLYGPGLRVDFRAGGLALGWDHQDK